MRNLVRYVKQFNIMVLIFSMIIPSSVFFIEMMPVQAGRTMNSAAAIQQDIIFPRGIYWPTTPDHLDEACSKGFNFFNFAYDTEESFNDEKINVTAMLERADELQTNIIFGLGYYIQLAQWDNLTSLVNQLKAHDCIKIWELVDEPAADRVPVADLVTAANIVRSLDDRPLFIQHSPYQLRTWQEEYENLSDTVDFLSVDPYPNFPSQNYSLATRELEFLSQLNRGRVPYFAVLKAFATGPDLLPRAKDLWFQTLLALQSNVSGVFYFWQGDYNTTEFPLVGIWDNSTLTSHISRVLDPLVHFQVNKTPVTETTLNESLRIYRKTISEHELALVITDHSYEWDGSVYTWDQRNIQIPIQIPPQWANGQIKVTKYTSDSNSTSSSDFPVEGELILNLSFESGIVIILEIIEDPVSEFDSLIVFTVISALLLILLWMVIPERK